MSAQDTLESRYRRMLTLLPAAYRAQRGEEMLSTLLDGAGDGRRWPHPAEAASVAALATRLRVGAPGGTRNSAFFGEVLRRVALGGLLIQFLVYVTFAIPIVVELETLPGVFYFGRPLSGFWLETWVSFAGQPLVLLAAEPLISDAAALLALSLLTAVAILLEFHRDAPRTYARRRWPPRPSWRRRCGGRCGGDRAPGAMSGIGFFYWTAE
jgi:hypothetical protein